ncbi:MAG: glucose-6-phosphate isomerase family protein [Methanocellales archaeon]
MELRFGERTYNPQIRRLNDLKELIFDKEWLKTAPNSELYYMYRDLSLSKKDENASKQYSLRYDITIIPPFNLGREYVKTAGHYHPPLNSNLTYPELYEVLEGKAHYLLQKPEELDASRIVDVVLIEAEEGDKVVIPPNYGHITINPARKTLKMANWVSRNFTSIYDPYRRMGGGAYFELITNEFIKNSNYTRVPEIRFLKPANFSEFGLRKNKEIYGLIRNPERLEFLNKPAKYKALFEKVLRGS